MSQLPSFEQLFSLRELQRDRASDVEAACRRRHEQADLEVLQHQQELITYQQQTLQGQVDVSARISAAELPAQALQWWANEREQGEAGLREQGRKLEEALQDASARLAEAANARQRAEVQYEKIKEVVSDLQRQARRQSEIRETAELEESDRPAGRTTLGGQAASVADVL